MSTIEKKAKLPRLVFQGGYEYTDPNGITHRRMVVSDDNDALDVHRYVVTDEARRETFFHSDSAMHEEFVRHYRLVSRPLSVEMYETLMALLAPPKDVAPHAEPPPPAA